MKCRVNDADGFYDGQSFHREDSIVDWTLPEWARKEGLSEKECIPPCLTPVTAGIDDMGKPGLIDDEDAIDNLDDDSKDYTQVIEQALAKLDHKNAKHWTQRGMPELDVVRELAGTDVINRAMIKDVNPGFCREVEA